MWAKDIIKARVAVFSVLGVLIFSFSHCSHLRDLSELFRDPIQVQIHCVYEVLLPF